MGGAVCDILSTRLVFFWGGGGVGSGHLPVSACRCYGVRALLRKFPQGIRLNLRILPWERRLEVHMEKSLCYAGDSMTN